MKPRNTLADTQAELLLKDEFFRLYLYARQGLRSEEEIADAYDIFTAEAIPALRHHLSEEAFKTGVLLTDRLSNRVLAVHLIGRNDERLIAVNTRFKVDPDVLAHTLIEEYFHSQQLIDGLNIEIQRSQFRYAERPYEQEAKRIATEILSYDPVDYEAILLREEPPVQLYDTIPD